ncbi:MAG: F0F1 ATP synthase subunit C [Helicobacteraceae bacterium]|jgi:F-type H+-transporting ATPase subunit c|nr:F0F1 ATP synthase subunit C [Helicobacteraceae bacterium]
MKKLALFALFVAAAFAKTDPAVAAAMLDKADAMALAAQIASYSVLAAVVGLGLAALGGAIGMGNAAAATIAGTARNPGMGGKLMTTMFISLAMIEAQVIYTLVFAIIALYANPYLGDLFDLLKLPQQQ